MKEEREVEKINKEINGKEVDEWTVKQREVGRKGREERKNRRWREAIGDNVMMKMNKDKVKN